MEARYSSAPSARRRRLDPAQRARLAGLVQQQLSVNRAVGLRASDFEVASQIRRRGGEWIHVSEWNVRTARETIQLANEAARATPSASQPRAASPTDAELMSFMSGASGVLLSLRRA